MSIILKLKPILYLEKRGLIAQNPFCAKKAYCTKLFCAITAYCTKPVLSIKLTSRGDLIAQNPENIARGRRWVLKKHSSFTDCTSMNYSKSQ